jgi:hypothetical protein
MTFNYNESKIEAVDKIVIEDPSYTDVIYETLQDTRRHIIRLEKEVYDKDAEIRSLKERIRANRDTMDAMIKMAGGR